MENLTYSHYWFGENGFHDVAVQAFDLLRTSRRYSASTLMALRDLADESANHSPSTDRPRPRIIGGDDEAGAPAGTKEESHVYLINAPYEFDEETETKSGGLIAAMAVIPAEQGYRGLLTVKPGARRHGVGSWLLNQAIGMAGYDESGSRAMMNLSMWLSPSNVTGAAFLAANALIPTSIARGGQVQWQRPYDIPNTNGEWSRPGAELLIAVARTDNLTVIPDYSDWDSDEPDLDEDPHRVTVSPMWG